MLTRNVLSTLCLVQGRAGDVAFTYTGTFRALGWGGGSVRADLLSTGDFTLGKILMRVVDGGGCPSSSVA